MRVGVVAPKMVVGSAAVHCDGRQGDYILTKQGCVMPVVASSSNKLRSGGNQTALCSSDCIFEFRHNRTV